MQCKQMWTSEAFTSGNKFYVFRMVTTNQSYFLLSFAGLLLCFTLRFITAYYECKK